jgi:hypothetical protein
MEKNLATAKSDLVNLENLLVQSTNRQAETESKLLLTERKVTEMEKMLAASVAAKSANNRHNDDNDEDEEEQDNNEDDEDGDGDVESAATGCGMATDEDDMNGETEPKSCCVRAVK